MVNKKEKKQLFWGKTIMLAFGLGIGVCCGLAMIPFLDRIAQEELEFGEFLGIMAMMYVCILLAMPVQVALHEAGHLLFGLLSGYGFSSYRVGGLMLMKENGKLRLCRHKLAGTGGQCLMTPPEMVDGKIPYVLYNLGGCIVNLAASLLFVGLYFLLPQGSAAGAACMVFAIVGVGSALMNGIPVNNGMAPNDGHNALSLGKDPQALRAFWVQMKVVEKLSRGVRVKDMPQEWFDFPDEQGLQNPMTATITVLHCNRLLDQGKIREADAQMERLLAMNTAMTGLHRKLLICDRIFCLVLADQKEQVTQLYSKEQKKFMKSMATSLGVIRTEYALAVMNGDEKQAKQWLDRFEQAAKRHPYGCEVVGERELLEMVQRSKVA